ASTPSRLSGLGSGLPSALLDGFPEFGRCASNRFQLDGQELPRECSTTELRQRTRASSTVTWRVLQCPPWLDYSRNRANCCTDFARFCTNFRVLFCDFAPVCAKAIVREVLIFQAFFDFLHSQTLSTTELRQHIARKIQNRPLVGYMAGGRF